MVREQRVTLSRGDTRYLEAGSGWPVVLLHAFPLNADLWRPQLEQVPDGWRYIAPDLRGFGPDGGAAATSMDDFAEDVIALLDVLEIEKATIGGLSMGGYVTFALLRRAPERASAVILADTRSTADTDEGRAARAKMLDTVRTKGVSAVVDEMLPKLLGASTRRERPAVEARVREIARTNSPEAVAGAIQAMRDRPDSTSELSRISVPVLILVGEEDTLTPPADAESMRSKITRTRLVRIPRAGHLSNLEAPEEFSAALADFLVAPL
jgi:pimeloyl-ACP methyl ester carboxylesterase